MIYILIRSLIKLIYEVNKFFIDCINKIVLKYNNVNYKSFPIIKGRIIIKNQGFLCLGLDTKFQCALKSNYVGIYKPCTLFVEKHAQLKIGNNTGMSGVSIYCSKNIIIGNYVNIGGNVSIWDTDFHPLDFEARRQHDIEKIMSLPVHINDDVFIGANSIILKGVTIGERSIIGAGSVVTKNVPCDQIWAGNPARFIRSNICR
jgi:acetyltransferase-like isoleucine patch superfamily enzyme